MYTFLKQPSEIVDYAIIMEDWFSPMDDDDYLVSAVVTCNPAFDVAGLLNGPLLTDPKPEVVFVADTSGRDRTAKIWIGGGVDGASYVVTAKLTTDLGRLGEVDFKVKIKEVP